MEAYAGSGLYRVSTPGAHHPVWKVSSTGLEVESDRVSKHGGVFMQRGGCYPQEQAIILVRSELLVLL